MRPLLLYYGVSSLARGLTLFLDRDKREASLKQSHGLQTRGWGDALSRGIKGIEDLRIGITPGLFQDLLNATGNTFYFRHNSSGVNWSLGAEIPPTDAEFTLGEVSARIPATADQYAAWMGKAAPFLVLQSIEVDAHVEGYKFTVTGGDDKELSRVFPSAYFPGLSVSEEGNRTVVETPSADGVFFAQRIGTLSIGDILLCEPLSSKLYFSPLAACFMATYTLGMMCRYFPTTWISIARTVKGDAFYPLAASLLDWIEETFPAMVVDILRGPYQFETS